VKRKMAGLALLAATALAAGCGGDEEEALSKAEYLKQGNKICADFNEDVQKDAQEAFAGLQTADDLTPEKAQEFFDTALPKFEAAIDDLDALGAPEGDEGTVQAIVDAGRNDAQKIEDAEGEEITGFVTQESATPDFDKKAEDYGLEECGTQG